MIKADLHIHTNISDGLGSPELIVKTASRKGFDVISVTDHDTFYGAKRAIDYSVKKKLTLKIIPGAEIRVKDSGDFLVFCLKLIDVKGPLHSLGQLFRIVEKNGCMVVPAHPLNILMNGSGMIAFHREFEWIECFNSWTFPLINYLTYKIAVNKNKKCIASSDAHVPSQIGTFYTIFLSEKIENVEDFFDLLVKNIKVKLIKSYSLKAYKDRLEWSIYKNLGGKQ